MFNTGLLTRFFSSLMMCCNQFMQQVKIQNKIKKKVEKAKQNKNETRKKKVDPLFEIEGNQKLNKLNKLQFKKEKKERARRGRGT